MSSPPKHVLNTTLEMERSKAKQKKKEEKKTQGKKGNTRGNRGQGWLWLAKARRPQSCVEEAASNVQHVDVGNTSLLLVTTGFRRFGRCFPLGRGIL